MDPQIEELVAWAKSQDYSDAEIAAKLAELGVEYDVPVTARDVGRSAVQGLTFGFGDEILGLLPEWLGGGEQAKEEMRARDKAFKKAHPVVAGASEIVAGLAVPGGAVAKLGKGAMNIRRAMAGGAAFGGGAGALAGAGAAEGNLSERVNAALPAAGAGAGLGALLPGGIAAGRAVLSPASRAMARLRGAVERSGGPEAVAARAREFEAAGRGREAILGDMGRPLQQATDFAANNSEEAFERLDDVMSPRALEVNPRVAADVEGQLGAPFAEGIADDLAKSRLEWAGGPSGFEGLRQRNPAVIPAMGERFDAILNQPRVRDALEQAREVGLMGPLPKAAGVSFEVLQGTKERLDMAVGGAFAKPGARDLAVRLRAARDELVEQMREGVPGYRDVADEYHSRLRLEEMLAHGQATYRNTDARGLKAFLADLQPTERDHFRKGLVSELLADLRRKNQGAPAARDIVRPGQNKREIMEAAFGSKAELERFLKRQGTELTMARTGQALAGSQTHRRGAALADPAGVAIDIASAGPMYGGANALRNILPKVLAGRTAREMGPVLATQGSTAIERLMAQWQRRPPTLVGPTVSRGLPIAGGLLGEDLMSGGGY